MAESTHPRKLYPDRRGAIMVGAAFMAIFLGGAIWYVFGVASAIFYRERVQDAADAVAFSGAVYHARGMNIIVTLNILMAVLLGLVVAARLLRFINDTANIIGCGCIPVPFIGAACSGVCTTTRTLKSPIQTLEKNLTQLYNKVGPALSKTQRAVAIAMPWVAEVKAVSVSRKYQPDVVVGAFASFSLVPMGDRLGLPVQEGDDGVLCEKVSDGLVDLAMSGVPLPGIAKNWVKGPLSGFVQSFCGGGDLVDPAEQERILQDEENDQVKRRCNHERDVSRALNNPLGLNHGILIKARADHYDGQVDLTRYQCYPAHKDGLLANLTTKSQSLPPGADLENAPPVDFSSPAEMTIPDTLPPCHFDRTKCEKDARAEIRALRQEELKKNPDGAPTEIDPNARQNTTPKVVYRNAENGDEYFQLWSVVLGDDQRAVTPGRGVEIAAHGRAQAKRPSVWGRLGWAQAEFYYDHTGKWTSDISDYEAMWNLRWRARLRRVRPPTVNILENAAGDLIGRIRERLGGAIANKLDSDSDNVFDTFIRTLIQLEFDKAADALQSAAVDKAIEGDNALERRIRRHWRRAGGIH